MEDRTLDDEACETCQSAGNVVRANRERHFQARDSPAGLHGKRIIQGACGLVDNHWCCIVAGCAGSYARQGGMRQIDADM